MSKEKTCSKCGEELRMWKGYSDKEEKPLCNSCVIKILEKNSNQ